MLILLTTSCVKEERFRSVEKHVLKQYQYKKRKDILIYGDSNVDVIRRTRFIDGAVYKSYKGKSSKNIPIPYEVNTEIKWYFFV